MKNYKDNFLLSTGIITLIFASVSYLILYSINEDIFSNFTKNQIVISFFHFLFSALIVAPIFEEIIFRSFFLKSKRKYFFKILFYLGISIYIFITENYYLYSLLFFIFLLDYLNKNGKIIYILNTLVFALIHYNLDDFSSFFSIIPVFFQIGVGFILIWIVINFNLFISILFHFLYNLVMISLMIISLQKPTFNEYKVLENEQIYLKWKEIPFINNQKNFIILSDDLIQIENVEASKIFEILYIDKSKYYFNKVSSFQKISLEIRLNNKIQRKINYGEIPKFLLEVELIKEKDKNNAD
jgi:hypothetical protein